MVVVAVVAISLFVYRTLGWAAIPMGLVGLPIAGVCHHWARTRPRRAAWGFFSSAVAINLFVAALTEITGDFGPQPSPKDCSIVNAGMVCSC